MRRKTVSGIMLTLLLVGMLTLTFEIETVKASATIYIRADGSVFPSTANITSTDNVTYTFTDDNYAFIRIEKDNIIVDGKGYILQGLGAGTGIHLSGGRSNVTIKNIKIKAFENGIALSGGSNNNILENNMTNNNIGISFLISSDNTVSGNSIANSGIALVFWSSNNVLHHNNFIDNIGAIEYFNSTNVWDNGYPSGGNYWSNYDGVDLYSGSYQNETGSDGIGDAPYLIDANNTDHYPLMNPWTATQTYVNMKGKDYPVTIVSNTALDQIVATANTLHFQSYGPEGEKGYVNVIFPMVNVTGIKVFVDGEKLIPPPFPLINSNGTHYFIYFEFTLSTREITIQYSIVGDATGDGYVNVWDLSLLSDAWLTMSEEPDFNPNCDFNWDDVINIWDLGIMSDHWLFDGDEWVSFIPSSEMVSLVFWMLDGISYVNATITFLDSGYDISYWGTVVREGQQIWVNSEIWIWTIGFVLPYVWELSHTYNLGNLEQGDYTFTFKAWNTIVKSIDFNVG